MRDGFGFRQISDEICSSPGSRFLPCFANKNIAPPFESRREAKQFASLHSQNLKSTQKGAFKFSEREGFEPSIREIPRMTV